MSPRIARPLNQMAKETQVSDWDPGQASLWYSLKVTPPPPSSPILQVQSGSPLLEGNLQSRKENTTLYICAFYLSRMVLNTGIQRTNVLNKWAQWNLKPKEIYQSSTDWNLSKQRRYLSCFHLSPSSNIEKTHPCYTLGTDKRYVQPFNADLVLIVQGGLSLFLGPASLPSHYFSWSAFFPFNQYLPTM